VFCEIWTEVVYIAYKELKPEKVGRTKVRVDTAILPTPSNYPVIFE
jgi:hypothetical protein